MEEVRNSRSQTFIVTRRKKTMKNHQEVDGAGRR